MIMYKLNKPTLSGQEFVIRLSDSACIPFDPNNTDYQNFKKDLVDGVALNDAEGNAMTAEQITTFLGTLK
jgi:hypothetical protein